MAKVGSYGTGPQGANPDDETTPINKDKFKEELRRVDAVDKTDPDQQSKKRKPGKEEENLQQAQQAIQESGQTTSTGPSILGAQAPSGNASAVSSVDDTSGDTKAPQSYTPQGIPPSIPPDDAATPVTSSQEADNLTQAPQEMDFGELDYDTPDLSTSTQVQNQQTSSPHTSSSHQSTLEQRHAEKKVSKHKKTETILNNLSAKPQKTKEQIQKEALDALEKYEKKTGYEPLKKPTSKVHDAHKKNPTHELQQHAPSKEEVEAKKPHEAEKIPEHVTEIKLKEPEGGTSLKPPSKEEEKKEQKIQEVDNTQSALMTPQEIQAPINQPPQAPEPAAPASYLSPEVHELFQTMIGLVMVKQITNEGGPATEMEISLNNPEYQKSKFFGLTIKITEFKSAPGSYNIELMGSGDQTKILQEQSRKLISALNDNRYSLPFTVNRLDVSLRKDDKEFLFKRKESVKGDSNDASDQQSP